MSFDFRFEPPSLADFYDPDLSECEDCNFDCCDHGFCIKEAEQ